LARRCKTGGCAPPRAAIAQASAAISGTSGTTVSAQAAWMLPGAVTAHNSTATPARLIATANKPTAATCSNSRRVQWEPKPRNSSPSNSQ